MEDENGWFAGYGRPGKKETVATLQQKGIISLTAATWEGGGRPQAVQLRYDRERNVILVRRAEPGTPNVAGVRKQNTSNTYLIGSQAFTQHYDLRPATATRYPVQIGADGVMVIDLNTSLAKPRATRLGKRPVNQEAGNERANTAA